jgi:hypothetical protein
MKKLKEKDAESKLEKLIQELEFKTLASEISEQKLKKEIETRKKYEKEITGLNQSLQDQASRLTELNRELKSFAYTVSHDIKAPLRGILGYSQELLKRHSEKITDRPLFCIQQIAMAATELETLIDDLLEYSRLELEIPSAAEVDIRLLFEKIILERSATISEYKTNLETDISCEKIWCWERGFTQALSNLIDNAIKYSRKSVNPLVVFSCRQTDDCCVFIVKDNGIGFDMQFKEKIFDLFHRLATRNEFEGTGAGLAIVKRVTDKMEGRVWAESSPGEGATFFIELPIKKILT